MMKFKLYLELGTRVQDLRLLDLLRFPDEAVLAGEPEWSVGWWKHGEGPGKRNVHVKRARAKSRERILEKIRFEDLSQMQLRVRTRATDSQLRDGLKITDAWLWFNASPTSFFWTKGAFASMGESYRKKYRLAYPSVLECLELTIATARHQSDAELQRVSIDLIREAMPAALADQEVFGYGCVRGKCRKEMMLHSMGGVPTWTDQLGEKFENIYPILIGPLTSCEGLAAVLGNRCSLIRISERSPSGILSIPPDKVEEVRRSPAVKQWVVIRDLSVLGFTPEDEEEVFKRDSAIPWLAPFVKR